MSNWMVPYDRLDPAQKGFVNGYSNGNVWLLGYAGSGKSILLVHLLNRLKDEAAEGNTHLSFAVVTFTRALCDLFRTGFSELGLHGVPIMTQFDLRKSGSVYDYIFCDEIQDMSKETLGIIKSHARKSVIVAGDCNQSIYDSDLMSNTRTVVGDEPASVLAASKKELNIIYRLTQSIIGAVKKLMPNMSQNWTAKEDLTKQDVQIALRKAISFKSECEFVYNDARKCCNNGERTAILIPLHNQIIDFVNQVLENNGKRPWVVVNGSFGKPDYNEMNDYLASQNIPIMYIGNSYGSLQEAQRKDLIILMTYASSKGLDFENVYMPMANRDMYITSNAERSRTTFMVAMTRSSHYLTLSYIYEPVEYLKAFKDSCSFTDESNIQRRSTINLFD